jgi:hypothetical protein
MIILSAEGHEGWITYNLKGKYQTFEKIESTNLTEINNSGYFRDQIQNSQKN